MEDIKITRINEENYKDIKWYLDSIVSYINCIGDLCFVDYNGIRYMVTRNEDKFVLVANENRELNPYITSLDDEQHITHFSTEGSDYELSLDFGSGIYGVKKDNRMTGMTEQLIYFPKDEELDLTSLDYYQVCQQNGNACIMSYELPSTMTDINYGLNYASFHNPSKIALMEIKKLLGFINHIDNTIFFQTPEVEEYRKTLFIIHNILVPKPFIGYNPELLMDAIAKSGYQRNIPDDLKGLIKGESPLAKRLEFVSKTYDNFTKGQ